MKTDQKVAERIVNPARDVVMFCEISTKSAASFVELKLNGSGSFVKLERSLASEKE